MNLDDAQRSKVAGWIRDGLKLSEIQNRLISECGVKLTYMEVRLLVDDLKLMPKDAESAKAMPALGGPVAPAAAAAAGTGPGAAPKMEPEPEPEPGAGGVSVKVDQLARPGALVSGVVTFSDGQQAEWYLDQAGRLGLNPRQKGYRPTTADIQEFQMALEAELSRMGM